MATVVDIFEINIQPIAEQLKTLSESINATKDTLKKSSMSLYISSIMIAPYLLICPSIHRRYSCWYDLV